MFSKMYWVDLPLILLFGLAKTTEFLGGVWRFRFSILEPSCATGDGLERTGGLGAIVQHETRCLEDGINKSEQDVTLVAKKYGNQSQMKVQNRGNSKGTDE